MALGFAKSSLGCNLANKNNYLKDKNINSIKK